MPIPLHLPIKRTKLPSDAVKFNLRCTSPDQISHAADLRSTYIGYEDTSRDSYPLDKLTRIAEFLQVPVTDLLDEYNRFLYEGQGEQMKAFRKGLLLTQSELSQQLQTPLGTVKRWEQNQARMTKRMWERMREIGG